MMKVNSVFITPLLLILSVNCMAQENTAGIITYDNYLLQVNEKNPDLKAARILVDSMDYKVLEIDMIYSPFLSGGINYNDDKSGPGFSSVLYAKEQQVRSLNLGLSKKWHTGSTITAGYTNAQATIDLLAPITLPGYGTLSYFNAYVMQPFLRVDQSLLRDFMSGMTDAGIKKTKASVRAARYIQVLRMQQIYLTVRASYLQLTLAREVVNFRKEALSRADDILKWTQNRVDLDLADKGDLLQAQAAYRLRKLNLDIALAGERKACRDFNELRGYAGEIVNERLEKLSDIGLCCVNVSTLSAAGKRADMLAAESNYDSSKYAKTETKYRSHPELTLSAQTQLYGLDLSYSGAWNQIASGQKPIFNIGVNLIAPLDIFTLARVRKGYDMDFEAAGDTLKKTRVSAKKDLDQLNENWVNVRERLALAIEIRELQSQRLENERLKYSKGRTTTFNVIQAENDLDDATLNVYNFLLEQIMTFAQSDLYNTQELK